MARFYGIVHGGRGSASRMGTAKSGLSTVAGSWSGAVRTYVYKDSEDCDCYQISIGPWVDRGPEERVIKKGRFKDLKRQRK